MSQNESTKVSTSQDVLAEVASALQASPVSVRQRLVSALTERELVKRVDMLDKGLSKLKEMDREINKIRPEDSFDSDGNKVPGRFTKAQFESLKKAREKREKLHGAMEKAFAGEGFDKLTNLVAGKEDSNDDSKSE